MFGHFPASERQLRSGPAPRQAATPPTGRDKTSIMFSVKDRVGALHDMLVPFKKHHLNMTKIESRPLPGRPWEYAFYLDVTGGPQEGGALAAALAELGSLARDLRVLGTYPGSDIPVAKG